MPPRRLFAVAVAVGLVGLSVPAVAAAAGWHYAISSASGSVVWSYSGSTGTGLDSVTFHGRPRRGMLHGATTYTDQNSRGCGPVTHTRTRNYQRPKFSVQGAFVVVTWRFPLPSHSYCNASVASTVVAQQVQVGVLSQRIPLSRFSCPGLTLNLSGQARLSGGGTTGTLTFQGKVLLKQTAVRLAINV